MPLRVREAPSVLYTSGMAEQNAALSPPEDSYCLETPEQVELDFDLAGPGTRFCAVLLDALVMAALVLSGLLVAALLGVGFEAVFEELTSPGAAATWLLALLVILLALLTTGYHCLFELLMRGQTPGKRALKIRAICDDGTPMGPSQVLIRNLIRLVDALPGFYLVGGTAALLSPTGRRLGDYAAGTLVVKEAELDYRAATDRGYVVETRQGVGHNAELSPEERQIVVRFLDRRSELLADARRRLAASIAVRLLDRHGGNCTDPEEYLERLIVGRHHEP